MLYNIYNHWYIGGDSHGHLYALATSQHHTNKKYFNVTFLSVLIYKFDIILLCHYFPLAVSQIFLSAMEI